jgi:predicted nucleotidyltransferase
MAGRGRQIVEDRYNWAMRTRKRNGRRTNGARRIGLAALVRAKRSAILRLAAAHGARDVRVFGSLARGEAGPGSDLDLLVRMEDDRSLLDLVGLWQDLQELLGRKVDVISEGGLSPHLRDRILAEAIPL